MLIAGYDCMMVVVMQSQCVYFHDYVIFIALIRMIANPCIHALVG